MSSRTIIFLYSQFQNIELAEQILFLLDEYDLGVTRIQVDSPESRKIVEDKVQETPAFVVKTGNTLKYYYTKKALNFIEAVVAKYPERRRHQETEEPVEEELVEEPIEEPIEELVDVVVPKPPPAKFSSVKNIKKKKTKKSTQVSSEKNKDLLSKWEDELLEEGGDIMEQIDTEDILDENEYFASSDENDDSYDSDGSTISVIDEDDEDASSTIPPPKQSMAAKMAKEMAAERKSIMQTQFPGLKE